MSGELGATIFRAPFIECSGTNPMATKHFSYRNAAFRLFEDGIDFFIKPPVVNTAINNRKFHFQNIYLNGGITEDNDEMIRFYGYRHIS